MKKLLTLAIVVLFLSGFQKAFSQTDSAKNSEIIVFINGAIVFADVLEVTPSLITYTRNDLPKSPKYSVDRNSVYVIIYGNKTMEMVTPLDAYIANSPYNKGKTNSASRPDSAAFFQNLGRGKVKVGIGTVRNYSTVNADELEITESPAALICSYTFRYNRFLSLGAQLGFHNYSYQYITYSDYDKAYIEQNFEESIFSPAIFARYDLLDLFVRPYVIGGVGLNAFSLKTDNKIIFSDNSRGVSSEGVSKGAKVDFIGRVGADLSFSSRFGVYMDFGTGINLIQTGVFFNLQ